MDMDMVIRRSPPPRQRESLRGGSLKLRFLHASMAKSPFLILESQAVMNDGETAKP